MYVRGSRASRARKESHLWLRPSLCRGVTTMGCRCTTCGNGDNADFSGTVMCARRARQALSAAVVQWGPHEIFILPIDVRVSSPGTASAISRAALGGAADGEAVNPERRLTDADGNALAVLAAGAYAIIELQIVADHRYAREHVRTVADERCALERRADPAVLDGVCLARGKHELARGDVHLAAAEVHGIDTALHRADDLFRRVRSGTHVRVGHARQRHMSE